MVNYFFGRISIGLSKQRMLFVLQGRPLQVRDDGEYGSDGQYGDHHRQSKSAQPAVWSVCVVHVRWASWPVCGRHRLRLLSRITFTPPSQTKAGDRLADSRDFRYVFPVVCVWRECRIKIWGRSWIENLSVCWDPCSVLYQSSSSIIRSTGHRDFSSRAFPPCFLKICWSKLNWYVGGERLCFIFLYLQIIVATCKYVVYLGPVTDRGIGCCVLSLVLNPAMHRVTMTSLGLYLRYLRSPSCRYSTL